LLKLCKGRAKFLLNNNARYYLVFFWFRVMNDEAHSEFILGLKIVQKKRGAVLAAINQMVVFIQVMFYML
jgi:hypothetical protein